MDQIICFCYRDDVVSEIKYKTIYIYCFYQCDQFTHNTKVSQETDVMRICKYLQGTKDNGLVFNPSKKLVVDFYADAYFQNCGDMKIHKTLFVIGVGLDLW